jgi:endonuclease/exonuclease/phosphatase family metal-dependent hydrolase
LKASLLAAGTACFAFLCAARCADPAVVPAAGSGGRVSIVAYNVKELFDAHDDGTEYPEYSVARGRWDESRYKTRLALVAEAVLASRPAASPPGPDVLCLEEIEGARALEDLRAGALAKARYRYSAVADAEGGPFANCVLSRLPIVSSSGHSATLGETKAGRDVLEVELDSGGRRLVVMACHWKSKVGGAEATEEARREAAALLRGRIAARLAADPGAAVVACGDFNESPDELSRVGSSYPTALVALADADRFPGAGRILVASSPEEARAEGEIALFSPWEESGGYSYSFGGKRERIDGFLLSPGLAGRVSGNPGLSYAGFSAIAAPFLVEEDGDPVAWDSSRRSGYSDHLPILLELAGGS